MSNAPEKIVVDFNGNGTASVIVDVPKIIGTLAYVRADLAAPQWQPIETAPRDRDILVWYDTAADPYYVGFPSHSLTDYATWAEGGDFMDGSGICIAKWFPQHWESSDDYGDGYWLPAWWFAKENDDYERVCNPTHWMPTPEPPK